MNFSEQVVNNVIDLMLLNEQQQYVDQNILLSPKNSKIDTSSLNLPGLIIKRTIVFNYPNKSGDAIKNYCIRKQYLDEETLNRNEKIFRKYTAGICDISAKNPLLKKTIVEYEKEIIPHETINPNSNKDKLAYKLAKMTFLEDKYSNLANMVITHGKLQFALGKRMFIDPAGKLIVKTSEKTSQAFKKIKNVSNNLTKQKTSEALLAKKQKLYNIRFSPSIITNEELSFEAELIDKDVFTKYLYMVAIHVLQSTDIKTIKKDLPMDISSLSPNLWLLKYRSLALIFETIPDSKTIIIRGKSKIHNINLTNLLKHCT